ncbi:PEP-CTERM sorting domain-containing protein [Lentimonas sp. CC19]|uniref:PEP-CTERM sorting domain-containing protein n=1 Tax=Lentimonas sp. CC19 TaxID=2676097 RepID=UPI0013898CE1|nr:PEP-CTERM sorting domain-containing protein [Lentimonas sp. CC19]
MKHLLYTCLGLFSLSHVCSAIVVDIEGPISNWTASNPGATAGVDYKFDASGTVLEFDNLAQEVIEVANPLRSVSVSEGYAINASLTPSYNWSSSGGLYLFEESAHVSGNYIAVRYSLNTGALDSSSFYFEINKETTQSVTLVTTAFSGALQFNVAFDYVATNLWQLNGTISDQNGLLWSSADNTPVQIASDVLANDVDDRVFFGANDFTQLGDGPLTKLSGEYGVVPEPAHSALVLAVLALALVGIRRR